MSRYRAGFACLLFLLVAAGPSIHAGDSLIVTGSRLAHAIVVPAQRLFAGSDSLYLNGRLLQRHQEYEFFPSEQQFRLNVSAAPADTLVVIYTPVPRWLKKWYGRPIPETGETTTQLPTREPMHPVMPIAATGQQIQLQGAKSFRFTARSAGSSSFSQSLDLTISGELAPGLEITGAVSDRGNSPSYGTANARLNELDRVNLTLKSAHLLGQIGDITVRNSLYQPSSKQISGASLALSFPRWQSGLTVARPKGVFDTRRFNGRDGFQGPYQVTTGNNISVTPGSERVWLDGRRLERGVNKDYTFDYTLGRITFSVAHPIDERSRIEIDFERQATAYRKELFAIGGGATTTDSTLTFTASALREGDDKEQPLLGEFSASDRNLLSLAGDSVAMRSSVLADSAGSYVLVSDSLPDSVYQYVGPGKGTYNITFSFVGSGQGDYRFLGSGRYRYVGADQGDYLPVVILPEAERLDYYSGKARWRTGKAGSVNLDFRASRLDRNLWSHRDDGDNDGLYLDLSTEQLLGSNLSGSRMRARMRLRQSQFRTRERLDPPEFARTYHLPERFVRDRDERLAELGGDLKPTSWFTLRPTAGVIDYMDRYHAARGGVDADLRLARRLSVRAGWNGLRSTLMASPLDGDGEVSVWRGGLSLDSLDDMSMTSDIVFDKRTNRYFDSPRGTRFVQWSTKLRRQGESIAYELYDEDSLSAGWRKTVIRSRLSARSERNIGKLGYNLLLSRQWLSLSGGDRTNLLGRTSMHYADPKSRLSVATSYTISDEQRNARSITYLEVDRGRGDFIFEDGQYVPDPDGNFIQVEELLSDVARVRRGVKSFRFSKEFIPAVIRFRSDVEEELQDGGHRSAWWLVPFYSDGSQPYLFYGRSYDGELRLIRWRGFHAVNLLINDDVERRDIAGVTRARRSSRVQTTLKQAVRQSYLEEGVEWFSTKRDQLFAGAGNAEGYRLTLTSRQVFSFGEISGGIGYRYATTDVDETSRQVTVTAGSRLNLPGRGELRSRIELYTQTLGNVAGAPDFVLTGNRFGRQGAEWSLILNYGAGKDVRVNVSIRGRHADVRPARITARGEVIAGF